MIVLRGISIGFFAAALMVIVVFYRSGTLSQREWVMAACFTLAGIMLRIAIEDWTVMSAK